MIRFGIINVETWRDLWQKSGLVPTPFTMITDDGVGGCALGAIVVVRYGVRKFPSVAFYEAFGKAGFPVEWTRGVAAGFNTENGELPRHSNPEDPLFVLGWKSGRNARIAAGMPVGLEDTPMMKETAAL